MLCSSLHRLVVTKPTKLKHLLQPVNSFIDSGANLCYKCRTLSGQVTFGKNLCKIYMSQNRCWASSSSTTDDSKKKTTSVKNNNDANSKTIDIVKVVPAKKPRPKIDYNKTYTENIFITPIRAMNNFLLNSSELEGCTKYQRRSPFLGEPYITVYRRSDIEKLAIKKFGSREKLELELDKIYEQDQVINKHLLNMKVARKRKERLFDSGRHFMPDSTDKSLAPLPYTESKESLFKSGSGRVVLYAICVNSANFLIKAGAWLYTGSHSLFAEAIHSMADTINQVMLAFGIAQSIKQPDEQHPYGWTNFRYVTSLISGIGIFFLGAGLSWYHGFLGLLHPHDLDSLFWAIAILGGSFMSEAATLIVAANQARSSAKASGMPFWQYVMRGDDPTVNVVLLEDLAAVCGVAIAGTCLSISYVTGNPLADAVGSLLIGTVLSGVASFIVYTNTTALVGRSIPEYRQQKIMMQLENDRMIRALHDVKATDMGANFVRFKAEVDFDGREVTRSYLEKHDLNALLKDMNSLQNIEDVEGFMLKHGENIIDQLGGEVDRIERNLKKRHPELRHVDLEQL